MDSKRAEERTRLTSFPAARLPREEDINVVEKLGDDEVGSSVDLLLEEGDVGCWRGRVGVAVGVACDERWKSRSASNRVG